MRPERSRLDVLEALGSLAVRLRLDNFNEGVCTRTGVRYRWTGERWVEKTFQQLNDLQRQRLRRFGIDDPEQSYNAFLAEIHVQPPDRLLRHLAAAPTLNLRDVDRLAGYLGPWKPTIHSTRSRIRSNAGRPRKAR
jgi:hypothetical protein